MLKTKKTTKEEKPVDKDVYQVPKSPYKPGAGSFGIMMASGKTVRVEWETCRDRFQSRSEADGFFEFLFHHSPGCADDLIEFMKTVEQAIRLPADEALEIRKTSEPNVVWIRMGNWWRYRLRRSLLTALLRAGQAYKVHTGEGFQKALWSNPYTNGTKVAIERFLSGYTASKFKGRAFYGWHQFFAGQGSKKAEEFLVKLKRKKKSDAELTGEQGPATEATATEKIVNEKVDETPKTEEK